MNILLLGSGGREHAFAWKIVQSPKCTNLYVAPGNAGTSEIATNLPLAVTDFTGIKQVILDKSIDLVVVGPEEPLVKGLVDFLFSEEETKSIPVVGPSQLGATLEGSKDFSKRFMQRNNVPTAAYETFDSNQLEEGLAYLEKQSLPIVLKADGLAAGKGVLICETLEDAKTSLKEMLLDQKFGEASSKVVIEEFLTGIELSVFVATDGKNYKILPEAKDYKRIGEGDTGLNTGGMGAVTPVIFADKDFMAKVEEKVVQPTVAGLASEDIPYKGFLFIGLMNNNGEPYVIEYNVRMGDPETEAVLPRIESDFVDLLWGIGTGSLKDYELSLSSDYATTVVMVSGGYPGSYEKGFEITLPESVENATIFHAGTAFNADAKVVNQGGRVIAVTGRGKDLETSLKNTFAVVEQINWDKAYYRKDIGQDILKLIK
ncbi:phosphoribosylamine--glycine ligase [Algoriphagus zhangzhouensis]|uniref:Phosphoribosylamine--glycine ligase n=1 Tax=Algoriphagus zhangzhouensis TaxID=1073327 RepID=A0A1M7ZE80_9BACT|nr:phosphoribosylamine--glycine ligase [Algoriphagus zhangzhouensis]TDY45998.1 phosphoribosylamine--glycine ligase [Algoriphagus zhangzhouensis]SHO63215.1 phosphoribosylamine--glycine ligase [Algoriphagus zhangzhouensis]